MTREPDKTATYIEPSWLHKPKSSSENSEAAMQIELRLSDLERQVKDISRWINEFSAVVKQLCGVK